MPLGTSQPSWTPSHENAPVTPHGRPGPGRPLKLAVIIVSYNSSRVLERCLLALESTIRVAAAERRLSVDTVVVDNGSVVRPDERTLTGARLLHAGGNLGFARAVNVALQTTADADYVLLLNPDTAMEEYALSRLLATAERRQAALVGPMLIGADNRPNGYSERAFHSLGAEAARQLLGRAPHEHASARALQTGEARCLTGACLLARGDFLRKVGGLDTALPMYLEDVELCASAHRHAMPVVLDAQALCRHELGGSSEGDNFATDVTLHLLLLAARVEFVRRRSQTRAAAMRLLMFIGAVVRLSVASGRRDGVGIRKHARVAAWAITSGRQPAWPPT